jgi:hypothetical protein
MHTSSLNTECFIPAAPALPAQRSLRVLRVTVERSSVTPLRTLVTRLCGDALEFIRIASSPDASKMHVWLCLSNAMVRPVMGVLTHQLPAAEFGRVSPYVVGRPS